jgi:hypothetical protein
MSDEHPHEHAHPHPHGEHPEPHAGVSRRRFLQGGAAALGTAVLGPVIGGAVRVPAAASLSGLGVATAGMHVHASSSEGLASWEQQYANAAAVGCDVLWMTDHDFRARARNYMTRLRGSFVGSTTGSWARHAATFSASGPIRVMVESAGTAPATQTLAMAEKPTAVNTFRTGVQGQTITHVFGSSRLDAGALYEVVVQLSRHPAQSGRPAGQYSLRYRFGRGLAAGRSPEGNGLVGVVRAPMPANGAAVTLDLEGDIRALWPDMQAIDHATVLLSFVVTSPRRGVVADVNLRSVTIGRARHDAAGVQAAMAAIAAYCSGRYPAVKGIVSEEVSLGFEEIPHCNVFGSAPEWSLKTGVDRTNWHDYYRQMVNRVHGRGGLVSWNHPMGFSSGPLLSAAQQTQQRRQVFASRLADDFVACDILEVGYAVRGHQPFSQHLALWDTFSRHARFLTGNGASDDHSSTNWLSLENGFLTGLWTATTAEADLVRALARGRAFTFHPRFVPGIDIDTLTGGSVPMGAASVSSATSRTVEIGLSNLPAGATVELVRGPVDFTGQDPGTEVVASFARSDFGPSGTGTVSASVNTATACFVRPQVRLNGTLVASGNPTWLLRSTPPGGIPPGRQA